MLRAALLFYKRLRGDLENMGFEVNPYDPCVANKMVNGKQMTICWHVDDLKVSHVDKNAVTVLALELAKLYGPKTNRPRKGTRVSRHAAGLGIFSGYDDRVYDQIYPEGHRRVPGGSKR